MPARRNPELPPGDLDKESKAQWKLTLEQLKEQNTWQPSDAPTLERYIRCLERARVCREGLEGKTTTRGSQGQLVQHPDMKTLREAEGDAHRYATDLLLTPASRKRAEVKPPGEGDGKFGGAF